MTEKKREIEIRSDEVQEIMTQVPNWLVRRGISLIFVTMLLLFCVAWFIEYPDITSGSFQLSAPEPISKLSSPYNGQINQLYFRNNDTVKKGDVIATMYRPQKYETHDDLVKILIEMKALSTELHQGQLKENKELLRRVEINMIEVEKKLSDLEDDFQFIAPEDGQLIFLRNIDIYEPFKEREEVFAILSNNTEYVAQASIPSVESGKIQIGQQVRLKVDNFPSAEYGELVGVVIGVSSLPENICLVEIKLTNGLTTTYNKKIQFVNGLSGTAEISTANKKLIDRITNRFSNVLNE